MLTVFILILELQQSCSSVTDISITVKLSISVDQNGRISLGLTLHTLPSAPLQLYGLSKLAAGC